jgi:hypothetical protein
VDLTRLPWQNGEPEPVPRHIPGTPIHQITALIPVAAGRRNDLAAAFAAIETQAATDGVSPFNRLAQVHMIRIEVLDTIPAGSRRPRRLALAVPTLLLGATFEGNTGHLARSLIDTVPDLCDAVFGCCEEYPGTDRVELAAWFRRYDVRPNLPYASGFSSRREVDSALARAEKLRRFMPTTRTSSAADLKATFMREFS